ncbi:MAG: hypothetical protein AB8H12_06455 [Lewinella sp.]
MKPLLQSLFLFLCFTTCITAQDQYFQLHGGLGHSGLFNALTDPGLGGALALEHHRPISPKTGFFVGVGGQYTNYEDQSVNVPCVFLLGDKAVTYNATEFYEIHRTDLTLSLGMTHQIAKLTVRGTLLPTMRLSDKIDALITQDFFNSIRPTQEQNFSIKPGERVNPEGPVEYTIDYTDQVQLQGEIGLTYAIEQQLYLGIAYRHGLSQYELQYKTVGVCGVVGCDEVDIINSRVDARTGHGYLTLGYTF